MDHQYCLYDTLLHVPLVIDGGNFGGGDTRDRLVSLVDLLPTLLDEAGIEPDEGIGFQGQSFHPDHGASDRSQIFAEYCAPQPSMAALERRLGELPERLGKYDRSIKAVRTETHKFIRYSDGTTETYDITDDRDEQNPLGLTASKQTENLSATLDEWVTSSESAASDTDVSIRSATKARLEDLGYLQ
jgi:arylsulfatase A-like enzyme